MLRLARRTIIATLTLLLCLHSAQGQTDTHGNFQAVDANGVSIWTETYPVTLRGIILNDPGEWLDGEWDPDAVASNRMGAQWQIAIQAAEPGDRGGTTCWMGQNYSSLPWVSGHSYDETQWSNEMQRINYDGTHHFRKGDLVDVTANITLSRGGKRNINEAHSTDPANDFSMALVTPAVGLPDPKVIRLADVVLPYDGDPDTKECIFDQTRQSGGELYQSMRVRLESVRFATTNDYNPPGGYYRPNHGTNGWGKGGDRCTVTDGEGRFFQLRMPMRDLGPQPNDWFSAVGVFNQDSGSGSDGTFGYELFVQEVGPTLRMVMSGGQTLIYWSGTYTNYTLEYTADLETWTNVVTAPVKWIAVEEKTDDQPRFYRLKQRD